MKKKINILNLAHISNLSVSSSCLNPQKPSWFKLFSRAFGSSNVIDWFMPYAKRNIRLSYEYESYNWQNFV